MGAGTEPEAEVAYFLGLSSKAGLRLRVEGFDEEKFVGKGSFRVEP